MSKSKSPSISQINKDIAALNKVKKDLQAKTKVEKKGNPRTRRKRRPKNPGRKPATDGTAAASAFLSNMMDPREAFLIPRVVPTEAVGNFYKSTIEPEINPEQGWAAFMVQPSLETPVVQLIEDEAASHYSNTLQNTYHHLQSNSAGLYIDFDNQLFNTSGGSAMAPDLVSDGYHYAENRQIVATGGKHYAGQLGSFAADTHGFSVHNRTSRSITVRAYVRDYSNKLLLSDLLGDPVTIEAGAYKTAFMLAHPLKGGANFFSIGFMWSFTDGSSGTGNLDISTVGDFVVTGTYSWKPLPFFTGVSGTDVMELYNTATSISTTGFSCLMQNNQNAMQRGGTLVAAKCAGGSRKNLPVEPNELITYCGNRNGHDVLNSSKLSEGLFWSYHPEKIQDVMFRQHADMSNKFLYGDVNLPYLLIAMKWSTPDSAPVLSFIPKINLEYITNSNILPKKISPCDTARMMEIWFSLGSTMTHVTENPEHLANIAKWTREAVRRTLGNPEFRSAALALGKGVIPLVASLL